MKKRLTLLCILVNLSLFAQDSVLRLHIKFTNEVLDIIERHSIFSDSIDWPIFRKEMDFLTSAHYQDTGYLVMRRILNELQKYGDNHSFWRSRKRAKDLNQKLMDLRSPKLVELKKGIGHLTIPSYTNRGVLDLFLYIDSALSQIEEMDNVGKLKGWIIDLRGNSGGNMYPMISSILPFIQEDSLGYFLTRKDKTAWIKIFLKPSLVTQRIKKYKCKNLNAKIAVLIDNKTASAAEMTAISLIGLPNVKLFGQTSAGKTTGNRIFNLSNGSMIALSTSWAIDRKGKIYFGPIIPDVITSTEETLVKAIDWIED
ncbi:MAG: S41 family peptidase [Chitinophagales bacterium]